MPIIPILHQINQLHTQLINRGIDDLAQCCQEIIKLCEQSVPLNESLLYEQQTERLRYQIYLLQQKPSNYADIILACEEQAYKLQRKVCDLEDCNVNLMRKTNKLEQVIMILSKNQDEHVLLLNKVKSQSIEILNQQERLDTFAKILNNKASLKQQIKELKQKKKLS